MFLHVDRRFAANGLERLAKTFAAHLTVIGGNLRLLFDGPDRISRWLKSHALYYLGVSPARLAGLYDSERRSDHSPTTETTASVSRDSSDSGITKGGIR